MPHFQPPLGFSYKQQKRASPQNPIAELIQVPGKWQIKASPSDPSAYHPAPALPPIIDELLRLPGNQQSLSHPNQRKWVEKELNSSLLLLDLIGAIREGSVAATAHIQVLQNSIRRRDCAKINESFHRDSSPLRSINKTIANSLRLLQREMGGDRKLASCSVVDGMLEEAREISVFLLRSASSLLGEARRKPKVGGRWGFVTRPMHRKKVACGVFKAENEAESMAALLSGIQEMEAALGSIFGRLIRNRVLCSTFSASRRLFDS